jgi:cell wall-associated NlpC family hydrolase
MKKFTLCVFAVLFMAFALSANAASIQVWANGVNVRAGPSTNDAVIGSVGISTLNAICQQQGAWVNANGYSNNWWTRINYGSGSGWVSNIFIKGDQMIAGVPTCGGAPQPQPQPQPSGSGPCNVAPNRQGIVAAAMWAVNSKLWINYSQSPSRWSGISQRACPYNRVPPVTDCSAFVTWLFWSAFGKGPDFINGQNWNAGYTGTMGNHGVPVLLANARPGDLVLYGNPPYDHVTLYVGNNKVVSFGQNGPALLVPVNYRGDYHLRSYLP